MADYLNALQNDPTTKYLEQGLNGSATRQKVISNNIANVETPGFKRSDVPFQDILRSSVEHSRTLSMSSTNNKHLPVMKSSTSSTPIIMDNTSTFRADGNNVDIDREMAEMAKNNVLYTTYIRMLTSRLSTLKNAIQEGR
jgi:flagellar basal-body rod protein FlgB